MLCGGAHATTENSVVGMQTTTYSGWGRMPDMEVTPNYPDIFQHEECTDLVVFTTNSYHSRDLVVFTTYEPPKIDTRVTVNATTEIHSSDIHSPFSMLESKFFWTPQLNNQRHDTTKSNKTGFSYPHRGSFAFGMRGDGGCNGAVHQEPSQWSTGRRLFQYREKRYPPWM